MEVGVGRSAVFSQAATSGSYAGVGVAADGSQVVGVGGGVSGDAEAGGVGVRKTVGGGSLGGDDPLGSD